MSDSVKQEKIKPIMTVSRDKHFVYFHKGSSCLVRYNLKNRNMEKLHIHKYKYRPNQEEWLKVETQYEYFRGYTVHDIVCKEKKFKNLLLESANLNNSCRSLSSFVERLGNALVYENYIQQNINYDVSYKSSYNYSSGNSIRYYKHFKHPLEDYNKAVINFFKKTRYTVTNKFERVYFSNQKKWTDVIMIIDSLDMNNDDKIRVLNNLAINSEHYYNELVDFGYDTKSLINYLINYLEPFENCNVGEGLRYLRDYYRMSSAIGRNIKKYPKYLKSMHDIIEANYKSHKKEYDIKLFESLAKPELEHKGVKYIVTIPQNPKDIVSEGTSLNHCVSSYVDRILERKTYIFFLREKNSPEDSLVTLELKDDTITQAKGAYNRALIKEERDFLQTYCKAKNLMLGENL